IVVSPERPLWGHQRTSACRCSMSVLLPQTDMPTKRFREFVPQETALRPGFLSFLLRRNSAHNMSGSSCCQIRRDVPFVKTGCYDVIQTRRIIGSGLAAPSAFQSSASDSRVHKQLEGTYHKGGYHVPFRHSFNRRHYRHGTC